MRLRWPRSGDFYYGSEENMRVSTGVKVVQEALHMYGFNLNGTADGKFGPYTEAIVKGFQEENGLTITGKFNKATLAKLEAWSGTLYETPTATPLLKTVQYGLDVLHTGDSGAAVSSVRGFLKQQGYNCVTTGSYDNVIESYVKQFQTKKGLTATGKVDQVTLAYLEDLTSDTAWLNGSTVKLTAGKLAKAGFREILLKPEVVADINKGLNKYGITIGEKVLQFLSQAMQETQKGRNIMEDGYEPGYEPDNEKNQSYAPFYGAGVLQLTGKEQYEKFSEHVNNSQNGYAKDNQIYNEGGKNLYATQHVALKYPGTSASWFWDKSKLINKDIDWTDAAKNAKEISKLVTLKVKGDYASQTEINVRYNYYKQMKAALPYQ